MEYGLDENGMKSAVKVLDSLIELSECERAMWQIALIASVGPGSSYDQRERCQTIFIAAEELSKQAKKSVTTILLHAANCYETVMLHEQYAYWSVAKDSDVALAQTIIAMVKLELHL